MTMKFWLYVFHLQNSFRFSRRLLKQLYVTSFYYVFREFGSCGNALKTEGLTIAFVDAIALESTVAYTLVCSF